MMNTSFFGILVDLSVLTGLLLIEGVLLRFKYDPKIVDSGFFCSEYDQVNKKKKSKQLPIFIFV